MIFVEATIECHLFDSRFHCPLRQRFANRGRGRLVAARLDLLAKRFIDRAGSNQGFAHAIVDDLGIHMINTAKYGQTRPGRYLLDVIAHAQAAPRSLHTDDLLLFH